LAVGCATVSERLLAAQAGGSEGDETGGGAETTGGGADAEGVDGGGVDAEGVDAGGFAAGWLDAGGSEGSAPCASLPPEVGSDVSVVAPVGVLI
jgi:hypothetical protein